MGSKPFAVATLQTNLAAGAAPAQDRDLLTRLVSALRAEGYDQIRTERTLLKRIRIAAGRAGDRREIVIDPRTGEILRDYSRERNGEMSAPGSDAILDAGEREGDAGPDGPRHHEREAPEDSDADDPDTP